MASRQEGQKVASVGVERQLVFLSTSEAHFTQLKIVESTLTIIEKEVRAQKRRMADLEKHGVNLLAIEYGGEVRIVMVGKTGSGKSRLGNNLLGEKAFESQGGSCSITKHCSLGERKLDATTTLSVCDTPGLFDTVKQNAETSEEIVRSISLATPGPHIYIFVIASCRFTTEESHTITHLQKLLGEQAIDHVIVVFTRKDDLEDITLNEYLTNSPSELLELLEKCKNRFAFINNKANPDMIREDIATILDLIFRTIGQNKGSYHTNGMYEEAQKVINIRVQEILEEKDKTITGLTEEKKQLQTQLATLMLNRVKYIDRMYLPKKDDDCSLDDVKNIKERLEYIQTASPEPGVSFSDELRRLAERLANIEKKIGLSGGINLNVEVNCNQSVQSGHLNTGEILKKLDEIENKIEAIKNSNPRDEAKTEIERGGRGGTLEQTGKALYLAGLGFAAATTAVAAATVVTGGAALVVAPIVGTAVALLASWWT